MLMSPGRGATGGRPPLEGAKVGYPVASYRGGFALCALFVLIGAAITGLLHETRGTNVHHQLRPARAAAGSEPRTTRAES
jgi:hypothetical protein